MRIVVPQLQRRDYAARRRAFRVAGVAAAALFPAMRHRPVRWVFRKVLAVSRAHAACSECLQALSCGVQSRKRSVCLYACHRKQSVLDYLFAAFRLHHFAAFRLHQDPRSPQTTVVSSG